jgi:hypothetical protein
MVILDCAANGFAEMEEQERQVHSTDHKILVLDYVSGYRDSAKQCYKWQKSNMSVRSLTIELEGEMYNIGLAWAWREQQRYNLREITN